MKNNTTRFDLSDYLIHFFRNVAIDGPSAPIVPECMGFANIREDVNWSAIFMLRSAIRHCHLWATWSYRNGRRTIYGASPAVCFTEMPLAAFLEAGNAREKRGEAMSTYALIFPKAGLFELGANPVIYGLDDKSTRLSNGADGEARIIEEKLLPLREQYRYVAFNPSMNGTLDWSHEREWRLPYRGSMVKFEKKLEEFGVVDVPVDIPGLDISSSNCSGMGVVVKTTEEARWIASDILTLVDRGVLKQHHYRFIMSADSLPSLESIRSPDAISKVINDAMIDLEPFYALSEGAIVKIDSRFTEMILQVESAKSNAPILERGGVWLWILDNTHDLTRSLLARRRVSVSRDGRYLAKLPEFGSRRDLRQRETMAKELARLVTQEFGLECGYFSLLGSEDYDDVPFYNGNHLENRMFYNVSWK
ncbi:DUF4427 domain-containing protein [Allochromatium vinosum]|uniref:DUF4427 domain-containing protein n=1 Tax=Allochromatium vinosum (strain ATCC 17899 / DSM 180 / NBRC 103801 / NCIMB 10441 / D) TaxID=572477 RepID=D3RQN5_ALLVD|nr:DUF4427 domain-containing protein [Allochromatium vinosum]ADC63719.1 conserved hypothetical protein [Allochromatium vinosum DSM 180]